MTIDLITVLIIVFSFFVVLLFLCIFNKNSRHSNEDVIQSSRESYLRDLNEDLEQLLSIASHDLREPLVGAAGFISLVISRYTKSLEKEAVEFLEEALNGTRLMERKIDDLLLLSRSGRVETDQYFTISDAFNDAIASLNGHMTDIEIHSNFKLCNDEVVGSRVMVGQVIQNIMGNAIKYKSLSRKLKISLITERYGNFVKVSISDNGIGFDPRQSDRIFQAFQRLHTSDSRYSGTGIGLAICRKIVTKHGGAIWAESKEDFGSTFSFTIPVNQHDNFGHIIN
ncbi:MAG TPA: hypothetical protein ENI61_05220 [Ignavibacteria bacterium]|nr:hypothetical protein [Ignavibacteria bacterium]